MMKYGETSDWKTELGPMNEHPREGDGGSARMWTAGLSTVGEGSCNGNVLLLVIRKKYN